MPWVVGIDEAGYGPNLGPLVQAAVALHLPDDDPAGWETLKPVVRRCARRPTAGLLIDDSKKVYTRGGLEALERGVLVDRCGRPAQRFASSCGVRRTAGRGAKTCAAKRGSTAATPFPSRLIRRTTGHASEPFATGNWRAGGPAISDRSRPAIQPDRATSTGRRGRFSVAG